ncbi:a disintegrin and metalloproteinase with thrombospondin motifs 5 [Caerostris extrusa]|uniref:A disintegrin and metalloproteinase with thrombospondin motifs 5 n=1 Tax=Caerostris extrusa TaxID=172846 RepID=A0AAV4WAT3_CAEEX|nr:a disintegrin and metalloproteinase with thrombospondin motifs 5 [Caerostris extrusa]
MLALVKALLLLFTFISFVNAATLYNYFQTVPEYEVVILQRSTKEGVLYNEVKSFNLTIFGRDIALRLEPNTFVNDRLDSTKVYKANIDDDNDLQFREVLYQYFPWKKSFKIYEDVANLASVSIECGEDEIQMEGSIGDLIIKPVPSGLVIDGNVSVVEVLLGDANHTQRTKVNDSGTAEFSTSKGAAHLIYKGQVLKPDTDVLVDGQDIDYEMNKTIDGLSEKSRRDVSVVYPEVLLLLADDIYDSFGGNTREVIKHYTNFMNEVNMRFKSLSNPRVVLSLVGILAAQQHLDVLRLGAHHDGELRGKDCPAEEKYIMNPALYFTNQWSPCSIWQIRRYLRSSEASCLYNKPRISTSYDAKNGTNFPN